MSLAQPELLGEDGIAVRPLDHVQKAEIRKTRAVVVRDRTHDFLVAARHQHVRDRFLDRFSFRDREHMRLAFGADIGHQSGGLEPLGLPQHGAGDLDRIVKGKLVDDVDRRAVEAGQPLGKLRAGRDFDLVRQPPDDLAEGPYLVVAVAAGDQQIGGMPQRPRAAFGGSPLHGVVEILQKRFYLTHFLGSPGSRQTRTQALFGSNHIPQTRFFRKSGE